MYVYVGPSSADAADSDSPQNGMSTSGIIWHSSIKSISHSQTVGNTNFCRKRKINENRKNISEIWNYFKRVSATHCQCNLCPNVYVISGTGTMRTHLKTKHKIVLVSKQITSTDANLHQQINLTEIIKPLLQVQAGTQIFYWSSIHFNTSFYYYFMFNNISG